MTTLKLPSLIGIRSISKGVEIFSIEARDMDMKLLSALESNNTIARCWFRRNIPVTTFGSWHDNSYTGRISNILFVLVQGAQHKPKVSFYDSCVVVKFSVPSDVSNFVCDHLITLQQRGGGGIMLAVWGAGPFKWGGNAGASVGILPTIVGHFVVPIPWTSSTYVLMDGSWPLSHISIFPCVKGLASRALAGVGYRKGEGAVSGCFSKVKNWRLEVNQEKVEGSRHRGPTPLASPPRSLRSSFSQCPPPSLSMIALKMVMGTTPRHRHNKLEVDWMAVDGKI
ncbi:hypothetical protein Tco_0681952 [Tanacetum coccineum]|uniref:Uncharacterized protein n=1 Tax=Tanacetum coccineum TaxID=301880 RepID=A0ABQ4XR23_9ASTR